MIIERVELVDYKRLDLLGITELIYTPESPYQLFTGKNGIGKSSLLSEFSPLPCDSTDLREGGYKLIQLLHRGKRYTIRYEMGAKLNASFICEENELNPGGTIKVQRNLIWEHFRYDNEIHELLLGNTLLSNMAPQQRREWFVRMSNTDMNYAISLFNRLKAAARDLKGAIKLNKSRLVSEQTKLLSEEETKQLKEDTSKLKQDLNHLLQYTEQNLYDKGEKVAKLMIDIEGISNRIVDFNFNVKFNGVKEIPELTRIRDYQQYELDKLRNQYKTMIDELAELQNVIEQKKKALAIPYDDLVQEQKALLENISVYDASINQLHDITIQHQVSDQYVSFDHFIASLKDVLTKMVTNPTDESGIKQYTRVKYEALKAELPEIKEKCIREKNKLEYHEKELTSLNNVHSTHCPNCHFEFQPGVNCKDVERLKELISNEKNHLEELEKLLTAKTAQLEEMETWVKGIMYFTELFHQHPQFTELFKYLQLHFDEIQSYPLSAQSHVNRYWYKLKALYDKEQASTRLRKVEELMARHQYESGTDGAYIMEKINQLENSIVLIDKDIKDTAKRIEEIDRIVLNGNHFTDMGQQLKQLLMQLGEDVFHQIRFRNNQRLTSIIEEKQTELATKEIVLNRVQQTETVIEQLTKMIEQNEEEYKAINIISTLLSPQDGLIAESLIGFLNQFLSEMANAVEQIWSYRMRPYLELGDEGIDLDYRFKVEIEGVDDPVKEISKLSRGQKEIIDFTFKLLLMQHLDMADYPVFMDEVGGSFDNQHRDRLYQYIKTLVEDNQISQVFIISHIATSHDALSLADKNVLDTDAIMQDETVNRVLKMK